MSAAPRDKKNVILSWIAKHGPFWDDDRQTDEDDYYEFENHDVTDQGLGEAARRVRLGHQAGVFSFFGSSINFKRDLLAVQHGLTEAPLGYVNVGNAWDVCTLKARMQPLLAEPKNWHELVQACRHRFSRLMVSQAVLNQLYRETYYPNVAKRVVELLGVLQIIMEGRMENGHLGQDAVLLWQMHSQGDKAWFSDESANNKYKFRNELTFLDPEDRDSKLFCPWHGKIKSPQFRVHFQWPVPVAQSHLKVLYIGPKITKK